MPAGPVVGYYVHHQGRGHAHRALAISRASELEITGLSTAAAPTGWPGEWVGLDDDAPDGPVHDQGANGRLHYVPLGHPGLRSRMTAMSTWIERTQPALMVIDVSVEVALLARLHGVPVVTTVMPGRRDDVAHRLGYDISTALLAPWPAQAAAMWGGAPADLAKVDFVGAISRYPPVAEPVPASRRVVVLNGDGGSGPTSADIDAARRATPGWEWIHLDRAHGTWLDDPWPTLCSASVVVSHAGQNALAEIAAARRPAVVIPQPRPFDEQLTMATTLARLGWPPIRVRPAWPSGHEWAALLDQAVRLDGRQWSRWNDGDGATRAAARLSELVLGGRLPVGV